MFQSCTVWVLRLTIEDNITKKYSSPHVKQHENYLTSVSHLYFAPQILILSILGFL